MEDITDFFHWRRVRGCDSKSLYPNEGRALKAARTSQERTGEIIIPYRCLDCTGWHIGHATEEDIAQPKRVIKNTVKIKCLGCGKLFQSNSYRIFADRKSRYCPKCIDK
jgi:DNA-directed RNA polymerase subunit N (RpoN/RPB10)